jgi:excisionase family DNA binding protein
MGMTDIEKRALKGSAPFMEVLAASIGDACRVSGLSRSEIYRRLASGDIRAVKSGSRTLILMDSLRAHLMRLPPATFRTRKGEPTDL